SEPRPLAPPLSPPRVTAGAGGPAPRPAARRPSPAPRRSLTASRIAFGKHVAGPLRSLPVWDRRLVAHPRNEPGACNERHPVDVARAVWEYLGRLDANDELGAGVVGEQLVLLVDAGDPVKPQAGWTRGYEVDEQHSHLRIREQIAHRQVHAVAVVVRECDRALV